MTERISLRDELDKLVDSDPFVPFEITMTGGDRYKIRNPRLMAFGHDIIVVIPPRRGGHSVLRFNQVSSINLLQPSR
jgi:hypothetical protein